VDFLEESFAQAAQQGRIRPVDPTIGAFSMLGMVLWVYKWFKPDGRLTDEALADGMVDLLFPQLVAGAQQPAGAPLHAVPRPSPSGTEKP
jgi:hypothetical protein